MKGHFRKVFETEELRSLALWYVVQVLVLISPPIKQISRPNQALNPHSRMCESKNLTPWPPTANIIDLAKTKTKKTDNMEQIKNKNK